MNQYDFSSYQPFKNLKKRAHILVGFSGGIDSSVTALLALQAGYKVTGIHMSVLEEQDEINIDNANTIASQIGIPLYHIDLRKDFENDVLKYSREQFKHGLTPNPCIICNSKIKFGKLLPYLEQFNGDAFATGHYARIMVENGKSILFRGSFLPKDQSYFLFALTQEQLSKIIFPLGNMSKEEVRIIARKHGLGNSEKKESQDACFVPPGYTASSFLREYFKEKESCGMFRSTDTNQLLGKHKGIDQYTIGQRKGTGIALGVPAWINKIDSVSNTVWMTTDEKKLMSSGLKTSAMIWQDPPKDNIFNAEVQIRYRSRPENAIIQINNDETVEIHFEKKVRAITPGQAAVVYQGNKLLGGGWILSSF